MQIGFNRENTMDLVEREEDTTIEFNFGIGDTVISNPYNDKYTNLLEVIDSTIGSGEAIFGGEDFFRFNKLSKLEEFMLISLPNLMIKYDDFSSPNIEFHSKKFRLDCSPIKNDYFHIEESHHYSFQKNSNEIYIWTTADKVSNDDIRLIQSCQDFFFVVDQKDNVVGYNMKNPLNYLPILDSIYSKSKYSPPTPEDYLHYFDILMYSSEEYFEGEFDQNCDKFSYFLQKYIVEHGKYFNSGSYCSSYLKADIITYIDYHLES